MQLIDSTCELLRPLASYAHRLPSSRPGKRIHKSTLFRWATRGSGGEVLRTRRLGSGRFTCDAWVSQFMDRLSGPDVHPDRPTRSGHTEAERLEIEAELGIAPWQGGR
jgi:Protein of unknown function (DUF1580)